MELFFLQISKRNSFKKIFLSKKQFHNEKRVFSRLNFQLRRNSNRGFIELEMLAWTAIIMVILSGFSNIHKTYKNMHLKLQKEFQNEWNNL